MRKAKREESIDKRPYFFCFILVTFLFLSTNIGCATANQGKYDFITGISFSPDGKKILFARSHVGLPSMIHVYNLETGELSAYQSPPGEQWDFARYSFDGKHIVFITVPLLIEYRNDPAHSQITVQDLANMQIAIMDSDGKNVRKITNTTGFKVYPSFSHSGRKIIFARADVIRTSGRTPAGDYDVYEVDVETGRETRLTRFKFFQMSNPYYFPDDSTFIFWAEHPRSYPGISDVHRGMDSKSVREIRDKIDKINEELQSKYQKNSIYVMQANEKELKPYLVMPEYQKKFKMYVAGSEYSKWPSLSADGSVLIFVAHGYKSDGSATGEQLYQYSSDGNHRCITHLPADIWDEAVSPNGELVAVIHSHAPSIYNIVIYQIKDGTSRDITLPDQPARIINSR